MPRLFPIVYIDLFPEPPMAKIPSRLSRFSTASRCISRLFLEGSTKVKAGKSFLFSEGSLKVKNKEHLFDFVFIYKIYNLLWMNPLINLAS